MSRPQSGPLQKRSAVAMLPNCCALGLGERPGPVALDPSEVIQLAAGAFPRREQCQKARSRCGRPLVSTQT
jgi:hypothetical protein